MKKTRMFLAVLAIIVISACSLLGVQDSEDECECPQIECPTVECPQVECPDVCATEVFEFFEDGDIDFVMDYDPTVWQYVGDLEGHSWARIVHRTILGCEIYEKGATEPPYVEEEYWDDGNISWIIWKVYDDYDATWWLSGADSRVKLNFHFPTYSDYVMDPCYSAGIEAIMSIRQVSDESGEG